MKHNIMGTQEKNPMVTHEVIVNERITVRLRLPVKMGLQEFKQWFEAADKMIALCDIPPASPHPMYTGGYYGSNNASVLSAKQKSKPKSKHSPNKWTSKMLETLHKYPTLKPRRVAVLLGVDAQCVSNRRAYEKSEKERRYRMRHPSSFYHKQGA